MRLDLLATEPQYLAHTAPLSGYADVTVVVPDPMTGGVGPIRTLTLASRLGLHAETKLTGAPVVVASFKDQRIAIVAGAKTVIAMEHGIGQSYSSTHPSYPGGIGREGASLFLTPNEHSGGRWRARYPDIPVRVIGSPRLDGLPARQGSSLRPAPVVAVAFHWPAPVASPWASTAFYEYRGALAGLAERYTVLGHAHPRAIDLYAPVYREAGIEVVREADEVLRQADILIADNTSLLYEFASTGRPVVVLDSRKWDRSVSHGLRFWDAADVGVRIDSPELLPEAISCALDDLTEQREARERALGIVYAYRSGAAERAVRAIEDVI